MFRYICISTLIFMSCSSREFSKSEPPSAIVAQAVATLPSYEIKRTTAPIAIDGEVNESDWLAAKSLYMRHPWPTPGGPFSETTDIKLLWDDENLYFSTVAQDKFVQALVTKADGDVYLDDCAEIFLSPFATDVSSYLGYEMNVNGFLLDYKATQAGNGKTKKFDDSWKSTGVEVKVRLQGDSIVNDDSNTDKGWILEAKIPLQNFDRFQSTAGSVMTTKVTAGTKWRGNVFRCMGRSRGEYAIWSPTQTVKPDFHLSQFFGSFKFIN